MKNSFNKYNHFTLDLAFNPASDSELNDLSDISLKRLLTESNYWEEDLISWIKIIRNDINNTCPEVVRKSSSLSMGLQFTNDETILLMNRTWRKTKKETDVLSFPILDEDIVLLEGQCVELGDIVVSVSTAKRQAKEMKHGLPIELRWLVSHGLLHLLGWDHQDQTSLERMLSFQEKLIKNNLNPYRYTFNRRDLKNISPKN